MSNENRWLLPEGIDELLPERAGRLEALRRSLLDHCETLGISVRGPSARRIH